MSHRYSHLDNDRLFATTFIDPRKFFKNHSTKDQVMKNILVLIEHDYLSFRIPSYWNPKHPKKTKRKTLATVSVLQKNLSLRDNTKIIMDYSESKKELENQIPNSVEVMKFNIPLRQFNY